MPVTDTPLRYPGGKSQMTPFVINLLKENDFFYGEYAEPFAGGCGIAMTLLLNDFVSRVYLNDIDPAIYAFWASVLRHTDELCELVETTDVTLEERDRQRAVFLGEKKGTVVARGFATLFLNRTNRSGILRGGVIGGKDQKGEYKLDCRFNRDDLVRKIRRIGANRDKVALSRLDAVTFLRTVIPRSHEKTLVNLDPPYFKRGPELYTNFYEPSDHAQLAKEVAALRRRWIVTYDDAPEIRKLYSRYPTFSSSLNYFAQEKRVGQELLVLDPKLKVPANLKLSSVS
jgi:DNA adenine methylase